MVLLMADAATLSLFLVVQEYFANWSRTDVHFGWDEYAEHAHVFQHSHLSGQ